MKQFLKKSGHFILQAILSVTAFAIVLIAVIQVTLMAGFSLLNTGMGRDLVQKQIDTLTADTPYDIALGNLFYDPVRGFTLYSLSIADADGPLLTLDRVSAAIPFEKLIARHLDLMVSAGTLTLHRLPADEENMPAAQAETSQDTIVLPDLYIRRASAIMTIDRLIIDADISGNEIILSPKLSIAAEIGNGVKSNIILEPRAISHLLPAPLPDTITLASNYDPENKQASIDHLDILSTAYNIHIKGVSDLSENGTQNYTLNALYHDLTTLTQNQFQSAALDAKLSGTISTPVLEANGKLAPAELAKEGLTDVLFNITPDISSDTAKALVKLETTYGKDPVLLTSHLSYKAPLVTVESLNAQAPYVLGDGHAVFDTQTMLADGVLTIEVKDFSHYKDLLGVILGGSAKTDVTLKSNEQLQSVSINVIARNLRYDTIKAARLDVNADIADISHPWPQDAVAVASGLVLSSDLSVNKLNASIKEDANDSYRLIMNGNGRFQKPFTLKASAVLSDFTAAFPSIRNIDARLSLRESSISASGSLTPEEVNLSAETSKFRLNDLPIDIPRNAARAHVSGKATLTGSPAMPEAKADLSLAGLDPGTYQGLSFTAQAVYRDKKASAIFGGKGSGIKTLNAEAQIPMAFSLYPFSFTLDDNAPINGDVDANLDLGAIAGIFVPPTHVIEGTLDADAQIRGTIKTPTINGNAALSRGLYKGLDTGIDIHDINGAATFDQDGLSLSSLRATDGENGTLSGKGLVSFSGSGTTFSLDVNRFHLPKEGMADGYVSAAINLKDNNSGYRLAGDIMIEEMNINIPERFSADIPELNIIRKRDEEENNTAKAILLDMTIKADNQVFVRGWGLDAEFGGDIAVTGSLDAPQLNGNFTARRGRYEEFGKRFELSRANLRFQGAVPPSPYLDIEATTDAEDVKASVLLTGPAQKPKINFSSVPSLPEDEVLARILFGKSSVKISPFQAIQLTQTLQRFSGQGGGGLDPLGMLRDMTGLDDISVETNEAGETNVGVGKYLTEKVYLEFERGKAENSGAASLQVELTPSINVETEVGQDARAGGGIFWSHDY